jgi:hypothetical protein
MEHLGLPLLPSDLAVGDDVSEFIGGDAYYVGKVEKITASGYYLYADGKKYVKKIFKGRFKVDGEYIDAYKIGYKKGCVSLGKGMYNYLDPHF